MVLGRRHSQISRRMVCSMKKTILALCLAIFPLVSLSETQRIDTVGGVLGVYKDPGQYGNAPVLFLGSIKNKILEDDRIQIDDRKKLSKDKELFLVSTNCNGSGCRVESHYLIMISKARKWKILAGPIETNGDVTLQESGKTLRLQYELYEGARVFQVTRTISQDGKISKEERKIISEPDFKVKDFSDLQRGDRLLGAAIHYGPVEQELKILGVFDKVSKHLDQYGPGFVLSPDGRDCVEFFADGTNVYGMETLVVKVWKNGKFFILMEPKHFSDKFEIYSNLDPRDLDLTFDSLRFSDFETGYCKVNTGEFRRCTDYLSDFRKKSLGLDVAIDLIKLDKTTQKSLESEMRFNSCNYEVDRDTLISTRKHLRISGPCARFDVGQDQMLDIIFSPQDKVIQIAKLIFNKSEYPKVKRALIEKFGSGHQKDPADEYSEFSWKLGENSLVLQKLPTGETALRYFSPTLTKQNELQNVSELSNKAVNTIDGLYSEVGLIPFPPELRNEAQKEFFKGKHVEILYAAVNPERRTLLLETKEKVPQNLTSSEIQFINMNIDAFRERVKKSINKQDGDWRTVDANAIRLRTDAICVVTERGNFKNNHWDLSMRCSFPFQVHEVVMQGEKFPISEAERRYFMEFGKSVLGRNSD